jgi:hypothetical protein
MAASDALNQDLFIRVYHSSIKKTPPHVFGTDERPSERRGIHAGTLDSAIDRGKITSEDRSYIHVYDVPRSMINQEVWADPHRNHRDYIDRVTGYSTGGNYTEEQTLKHRIPKQPELSESVPIRRDPIRGTVLQYRNDHEDPGSISYLMHTYDIDNFNDIDNFDLAKNIRYHGVLTPKEA